MQHYYHTIPGWFPYDFLYSQMVNMCHHKQPYKFVEVGSWKGRSTAYMAVEIINSNKNIKFYCIDTWNGSEEHMDKTNPSYESLLEIPDALYKTFLNNIEPVKSVVIPIRMSSTEASRIFDDNSLDFILLDAAHDYENVTADLEHWYPKLKFGGLIAGDDISWTGVRMAVEKFFENKTWFRAMMNGTDIVWAHEKSQETYI